jgi:hypothetical protein
LLLFFPFVVFLAFALVGNEFPCVFIVKGFAQFRRTKSKYPSQWAPATAMVAFNGCPDDTHKPSSVPIYQTATFIQPSAAESAQYDYTQATMQGDSELSNVFIC